MQFSIFHIHKLKHGELAEKPRPKTNTSTNTLFAEKSPTSSETLDSFVSTSLNPFLSRTF